MGNTFNSILQIIIFIALFLNSKGFFQNQFSDVELVG
jgi:hypothetical protein